MLQFVVVVVIVVVFIYTKRQGIHKEQQCCANLSMYPEVKNNTIKAQQQLDTIFLRVVMAYQSKVVSSKYVWHHKKMSHSKHLCGRRVHVETIMVRVSVIRVRGGSGNRTVIVRGLQVEYQSSSTLKRVRVEVG